MKILFSIFQADNKYCSSPALTRISCSSSLIKLLRYSLMASKDKYSSFNIDMADLRNEALGLEIKLQIKDI